MLFVYPVVMTNSIMLCYYLTEFFVNRRDPEDITVSYNLTSDSGYDYEANRRTVFDKTKTVDSVKMSQVDISIDGVERCQLQKVYVVVCITFYLLLTTNEKHIYFIYM